MNVKTTIAFVAVTAAISAEELPRKTSAPRESYPNVDVIYDSVATPDGKRLRTIITKPHNAKEKLPVIFVAGWLSCDSVEAPAGTKDESGLVFRGLAKLPEFALFRMDKQGVGDSEGVCAEMLEIERRRFGLMGKSPAEVNDRMKGAATLYHEWLIKGRPVDDIVKEQPQLAELWPEGKDHAHLYGRPLAFYQQLQQLNLAAAWSRVKVPTYVLHGAFDWIMTQDDSELIAAYVNKNGDLASFYEIPNTGHTFQHYLSLADAFKGKSAPFDPKMIGLLADWLRNQAITHED